VSRQRRLRLGVVHFLNSWPLAWGLKAGHHAGRFAVSFLPPSTIADRMAAGELEVGLLPSAELQRLPGLSVVPGLCIAARHEVKSVLLVSRVPLPEVRSVALDLSSRTSAVLVQVLLAERWGVTPEVLPSEPDLRAMLDRCDAALLIGDPALAVERHRYQVIDLAAEWQALTDLPFVFAVWAVAPGVPPAGIVEALEASYRHGRNCLEEIVARAAAELALPGAGVRDYLTRHLSYRLGAQEHASLAEFFRRAHRLGLLPEPRPLTMLGGPEPSRA
jgi:chorismate dehydratase